MTSPLDNANNGVNPLLSASTLPYGAPEFDKIKTAHFLPALEHATGLMKAEIDAIVNNPAAPTFANTIEALEAAGGEMSNVQKIFSFIAGANSNDEIREMQAGFNVASVKVDNDIMMNAALFARVKAVYDTPPNSLTGEQKMLLEKTYQEFVRSGALLDDAGKARLSEVTERLTELTTQFLNNVTNATDAYEKVISDESELAGIPERVKNNYKQAAEEAGYDGKWLIKLSPPPIDFLQFCENRALREEVQKARTSIATTGEFDNRDIILEVVRLRHEHANLLGYPTHAAYILDERMMKTPEAVMNFLNRNDKVYRPASDAFMDELRAMARQDGIADFKPWDTLYYWRKAEEKKFSVDMEAVRPYFDLEKTLDGLRQHAEKLFGITMNEASAKYPTYSPDVKAYEITDQKTGEIIGLFYADYYARPGAKQNGAWEGDVRMRAGDDISIVYNVCNFDKPTKEQPTLLSIDEVTTLFHEFGHALHALLARGSYSSLNGTNVKWDFVELPSQLQENWVTEKETLDTFARHYQTGELLPAEMIQKIKDASQFGVAYEGLRQTYQALLDMKWHMTDPNDIKSVEELEDGVIADHWIFKREAGLTSTGFDHIFAGATDDYSAGYNSYKVAAVLEADVFAEFKKKGLYDPETAQRLRDTVYTQGGTVDPMELFKQLMGREPDQSALFRREGLLPPEGGKPGNKPKSPTP